jgi:hypothetical protein
MERTAILVERVVGRGGTVSEITDFYESYIEAFNSGDRAGFAEFFHRPVTVVHAPRYDDRRAGRELVVVDDPDLLWAPLPDHWERSTIDQVVSLDDAAPFVPRSGLVAADDRRPGIIATVTRWHLDGRPYEHIQALYVLTREQGRLGIKVLVELAVLARPS